MDWFKRYTIPGGYLIILFSIYLGLDLENLSYLCYIKEYSTLIAGLIVISILPIGYILIILTQYLYYLKGNWNIFHIRREVWNETFKDKNHKSELLIESKLQTYFRFLENNDSSNVEKSKWVQEFFSKRVDVNQIFFICAAKRQQL